MVMLQRGVRRNSAKTCMDFLGLRGFGKSCELYTSCLPDR